VRAGTGDEDAAGSGGRRSSHGPMVVQQPAAGAGVEVESDQPVRLVAARVHQVRDAARGIEGQVVEVRRWQCHLGREGVAAGDGRGGDVDRPQPRPFAVDAGKSAHAAVECVERFVRAGAQPLHRRQRVRNRRVERVRGAVDDLDDRRHLRRLVVLWSAHEHAAAAGDGHARGPAGQRRDPFDLPRAHADSARPWARPAAVISTVLPDVARASIAACGLAASVRA